MYSLTPPLAFRAIQPEDQAFLDALYVTSREDLYGISPDPEVVMQVIQMQQQVQTQGIRDVYPNAQLLLLESGSEPIGRVVVDVGPNDIRLVDIAIVPRHRRHGAARAVLQSLQDAAKAQGLAMTVAAAKFNDGARQLYSGMGFVVRSDDGLIEQYVWPASRLTSSVAAAESPINGLAKTDA